MTSISTEPRIMQSPFNEHEEVLIRNASVWVVDASRGDLYVVMMHDRDILVQLIDGGIADRADQVLNVQMPVLIDEVSGDVIGMPIEGTDEWRRCRRLLS